MELTVNGEIFSVRRGAPGVLDITWLSGPNPGYGFSVSVPAAIEHVSPGLSDDAQPFVRARVVEFLAMIDPATGYIG